MSDDDLDQEDDGGQFVHRVVTALGTKVPVGARLVNSVFAIAPPPPPRLRRAIGVLAHRPLGLGSTARGTRRIGRCQMKAEAP